MRPRFPSRSLRLAAPLALALLASGCELVELVSPRAIETRTCPDVGGTTLVLEVRDQFGRPAATGAALAMVDRDYLARNVQEELRFTPLHLMTWHNRPGRYLLRVTKPWYAPGSASVWMPDTGCGVERQRVQITLHLLRGAPAVRGITVFPPLGVPRSPATAYPLQYVIETNPGVDSTLTWQSSDSSVAIPRAGGFLTLPCRVTDALVTVTATSVADPSQSGAVTFGVRGTGHPCP